MTKTETFSGSFDDVQRQAAEWVANNSSVRLTHFGAPFAVGDKIDLHDGIWTITIRYDDASGGIAPADVFSRCGQALCGTGPDWKAQFGRLLGGIKPDTIDAMTRGKSRIPPGVWGEIAVHLHDREMLGLAALKAAAIHASLGSLARVYKVRNVEFSVEPSAEGRWPRVKLSAKPYNQVSWWRYAEDDERVLPDDTVSLVLELDGEAGQPFMIGMSGPFYPPSMKRAA